MEPRIETHGPFVFVGLVTETTLADNRIPALWQEFGKRFEEIPQIKDRSRCFGITDFVEPEDFDETTSFRYTAAAEVESADDAPDGMVVRRLPARRYAIFTHRGPVSTLDKTYEHIYANWLPTSGEEPACKEELEVYDERFDMNSEDSELEIWVPLQ